MVLWKYVWPNALWDIVWELAQVLMRQGQGEASPMTTVLAWAIAVISIFVACLLLYRIWKWSARLVRRFPYARIREWFGLVDWAFGLLDRTLSSLLSGLSLLWGGEQKRRTLLRDLRALRQAQQQYDAAKGQDSYAASTIGVLMEKYPEIFSHVEQNPDEQKAAVEFCIAVLENREYPEAVKIIQEKLMHPFRVRPPSGF